MLDEKKIIELSGEREEQEIEFFLKNSNIGQEEINGLLNFSKEIKETAEIPEDGKNELIKKLCNSFSGFFEKNQDKKEINVLLPISSSKILSKPLRKSAIEVLFGYLTEEEKYDIELALDEIVSNIYSHSSPESHYALLSFVKENEKVSKITTLNFSDKEMPPHILNLLKNQKNKEEALNDYSCFDEKRINSFCQEEKEEETEEICHQRGLEILLNLTKNIQLEEITDENLGKAYKFEFEL